MCLGVLQPALSSKCRCIALQRFRLGALVCADHVLACCCHMSLLPQIEAFLKGKNMAPADDAKFQAEYKERLAALRARKCQHVEWMPAPLVDDEGV